MALVKFGGGVLDMRGSIGGNTFSKNRYGAYVRARTTPVNPQTNRQSEIRSIIQYLSQAWSNDLSAANIAAWEVYAAAIVRTNKLGATMKLTGFNHFIRSNACRIQNGASMIANGPGTLTLPGGDSTFAAVVDSAAQQLSITFDNGLDWASDSAGHLGVYMSLPKSSGTTFIAGPYRQAGTIDGAASPPASPQVLACPFPVHINQQVKVKARIMEGDGRLSDPFLHQSGVVA